jgi:tRNA pseudouridine13 synthase
MNKYLTQTLPGTGGSIRQEPAAFRVEEVPLYEPCGEGEHLYLRVEKQGLTTFDLLRKLSRELGCRERDIGYAGLKDARAIAIQSVSIPLGRKEDVARLEIPGVRILAAEFHRNKLRPGHLAGNRFSIRIHHPGPDALQKAETVLDALVDLGVPNRFGAQRYGILGNSHRIGHLILCKDFSGAITEIIGDPDRIEHPGWQAAAIAFRTGDLETAEQNMPRHCQNERQLLNRLRGGSSVEQVVLGLPRKLLRLYLSAYQSSLFDRMVDMRLSTIEKVWPGDLAYKHINGACFLVDDQETEQLRADSFEISPSGPMFGCKMTPAQGQAGLLEQSLLDKEQLNLDAFRLGKGLTMEGERRPLRVPLRETGLSAEGDDLRVDFMLPKGSFATAVLHEIIKPETAEESLAGALH